MGDGRNRDRTKERQKTREAEGERGRGKERGGGEKERGERGEKERGRSERKSNLSELLENVVGVTLDAEDRGEGYLFLLRHGGQVKVLNALGKLRVQSAARPFHR